MQRCDEGKPKCVACSRLGIECLGYGAKRPRWLRDEANAKRAKLEIKEKVSKKRASHLKREQGDETVLTVRPMPSASGLREISTDDQARWETEAGSADSTVSSPVPVLSSSAPLNLDSELDEVWRLLFGQIDQNQWPNQWFSFPAPSAGPTMTFPNQNYLHHYLKVVLPLQYRFTGSLSIGELVAPLAMAKTEVLTSVSSLAALHMSVKRNRAADPTTFVAVLGSTDDDARIAISSHRASIERLRFISSSDFTAEDVILSAMFAVSYHTFMGGTSKEWKELLAISQRCLSAALAGSPELIGGEVKWVTTRDFH